MLMDGFTLATLGSGCQYVTLIGPHLSTECTADNRAYGHFRVRIGIYNLDGSGRHDQISWQV